MTNWLLLKDEQKDRGEVMGIKALEPALNRPESDVDRLVVATALFNGDSSGDAAKSLAQGGGVALRLLARQYRNVWPAAPLKKLSVETLTPLSGSYDGHSADLLYALVTFLRLAEDGGLIRPTERDFAATGTLDIDGVVGPVKSVVPKIEAAIKPLPQGLPFGSIVFYPRKKPEDETRWVDEELIDRARARGIELQSVDFIEEALAALGIEVLWWHRDQPPYRALGTYQVEHSPIFFGRNDQVTKFLDRLQQASEAKRPGGLVEASSGAGKSSFVQAGLLARLRILPSKNHMPVEYAVWQPRLASAGQATEIDEAALTKSVLLNWRSNSGINSIGFRGIHDLVDVRTLDALCAMLSQTSLDDRHLVWVVDQFEELFTQKYTDEARIAFARFLAQLQALGVWVIGTLRTEFTARFRALADERGNALMGAVFEDLIFPLARMPDESIGQMITEPAKVAGVSFELRADGVRLDALLTKDALGADSMPLVGYALNELWLKRKIPDEADERGRKTPVLTFDAYKVICGGQENGGIKRVLGIEAERAYERLPQSARDELPQLLDALAVPTEGEEKEAARPTELARWQEGTPGWQLIEALREKRLLITEPATETTPAQVRVVHEALFEGWESARNVLDSSRVRRLEIEYLRRSESKWRNGGYPDEWLVTSPRDIENAKAYLAFLSADERDLHLLRYLTTSIEIEETKQAKRRDAAAKDRLKDKDRIRRLALISIVAICAAIFAVKSAYESEINLTLAQKATAKAETERQRALTKERDAKIATDLAKANEKKAKDAAIAEKNAQQAEAAQTQLANKRGELANLANKLTQATLDGTVEQISKPEFQEDAQLEGLQTAILDELAPIYLNRIRSEQGKSKASTLIGYAHMVERIAKLQASNQSIETAIQNTEKAWAALQGARIENVSDPRLDSFVENLALTYLSIGEPDSAKRILNSRTNISTAPEGRQCTLFRIEMMKRTVDFADLDRAEQILNATIGSTPKDSIGKIAKLACMADLLDLFIYNNEELLITSALKELKSTIGTALAEKPKSVSYLLISARIKLQEAKLSANLLQNNTNAALPQLDEAAKMIEAAWRLAPRSRLVLESLLLFIESRQDKIVDDASLEGYPALKAAASEWTKKSQFGELLPSYAIFEELIERDPQSAALARRYSFRIRQHSNNLTKELAGSPVSPSFCFLIVSMTSIASSRHPQSRVAADGLIAAEPCAMKLKNDPKYGSPEFFDLYINQAEDAHLLRVSKINDATRIKVLSAAVDYFNKIDTEESLGRLYRLAQAEAAMSRDSIRFTRIAWNAILRIAEKKIEGGSRLHSKELLAMCKPHSEKQKVYCDGVVSTLENLDLVDTSTLAKSKKFSKDWAVVSIDEVKRVNQYPSQATPTIPSLVALKRDGTIKIYDDIDVSLSQGVKQSLLIQQREVRDKWARLIRRADSRGISVSQSLSLISRRYWSLEPPAALAGNKTWATTEAGKTYIANLTRLVYGDSDTPPNLLDSSEIGKQLSKDKELSEELVTLILQGKNTNGLQIFTYVELTLKKLFSLREIMKENQDFNPSEFGKILASGFGVPSRSMRKSMNEKYGMINIPRYQLYEFEF